MKSFKDFESTLKRCNDLAFDFNSLPNLHSCVRRNWQNSHRFLRKSLQPLELHVVGAHLHTCTCTCTLHINIYRKPTFSLRISIVISQDCLCGRQVSDLI